MKIKGLGKVGKKIVKAIAKNATMKKAAKAATKCCKTAAKCCCGC